MCLGKSLCYLNVLGACRFRSALMLAEEVRSKAKVASRLMIYLRASLESMSHARSMLDPVLGGGLAIEAINLLQNEDLAAENRILRAKLPSRLRLSDP